MVMCIIPPNFRLLAEILKELERERRSGWTDRQTDRRTDGPMDRRTDGPTDAMTDDNTHQADDGRG